MGKKNKKASDNNPKENKPPNDKKQGAPESHPDTSTENQAGGKKQNKKGSNNNPQENQPLKDKKKELPVSHSGTSGDKKASDNNPKENKPPNDKKQGAPESHPDTSTENQAGGKKQNKKGSNNNPQENQPLKDKKKELPVSHSGTSGDKKASDNNPKENKPPNDKKQGAPESHPDTSTENQAGGKKQNKKGSNNNPQENQPLKDKKKELPVSHSGTSGDKKASDNNPKENKPPNDKKQGAPESHPDTSTENQAGGKKQNKKGSNNNPQENQPLKDKKKELPVSHSGTSGGDRREGQQPQAPWGTGAGNQQGASGGRPGQGGQQGGDRREGQQPQAPWGTGAGNQQGASGGRPGQGGQQGGDRREGQQPQGPWGTGAGNQQGASGGRPGQGGQQGGDRREGQQPQAPWGTGAGNQQGASGGRPGQGGQQGGDRREGQQPQGPWGTGAGNQQGASGGRPGQGGQQRGDRREGQQPQGPWGTGAGNQQGASGGRPGQGGQQGGDRREGQQPQGPWGTGAGNQQGASGGRPGQGGQQRGDRREGQQPQAPWSTGAGNQQGASGGRPGQGGQQRGSGYQRQGHQSQPRSYGGQRQQSLQQNFDVETNYLTLNLEKMPNIAYHYDVKIDPDRPKKFIRKAFELFILKFFPKFDLAYDGKANAYSTQKLPENKLNESEGAEVKVLEGVREIPFKVTVKPTEDMIVDLNSLRTYHNTRIFDKPMRALQCLEVVLSSPCYLNGVRAGRSFFVKPNEKIDLGDGYELWFGLFQAPMLCEKPLLNVDVSHKSFPSEIDLLTFYENLYNKSDLYNFLKGLRVLYTPPKCFNASPKEFKFIKVMASSSKQDFTLENGTKQTIENYYKSKNYKLVRPDLPCLHVGSTVKAIYLPLELLSIPAGQAIMRKDNESQVSKMIRFASTATEVRKRKILNLVHFFHSKMHPTVERFGISLGKEFISVPARLLPSPQLKYNQKYITIENPGEWNMRDAKFLETTQTLSWAIINLSKDRRFNQIFLQDFAKSVIKNGEQLNMTLNACNSIIICSVENIKEELQKLKNEKCSLAFVVLPFMNDAYRKVKQAAELSCGIVTQCIKDNTMKSARLSNIISQMLLKVNAKLNGINHIIAPVNEIKLQQSEVMFVGADVSHPSPLQKNIPSIVGVVASHDLNGTKYNMQYRLQAAREETIQDMKSIFAKHLKVFQKHTKTMPKYVVYYRDGVSDGQFQKIENIELASMRAACKDAGCDAKFTCIIVVKRHHTRFFPGQQNAEGKFNNVRAGTVVDQKIVHPGEVQFFMVSHKSIQGTARPTRYNVIVDDAKMSIHDLQRMTYNLCHLFPRCNRSVSLPTPAYLAHLVGSRGRVYIEGTNLNLDNLKGEYEKRRVSDKIMEDNPMYFV